MRHADAARGLLHNPAREHVRLLPSAALAPLVAHYWFVRWADGTHEPARILAHPCVHVVFERKGTAQDVRLHGIPRDNAPRPLEGSGSAFGIKFRPGSYRALSDVPLSALTGRIGRLHRLCGQPIDELARHVFAADGAVASAEHADTFLRAHAPAVPPHVAALRDVVEHIASDSSVVRVEQIGALAGLERRSLERAFRDVIGVPPKWVLRRYRLHEAAARLSAGADLAQLAVELGYADQAHFCRDFKRETAETPRDYAARRRATLPRRTAAEPR